jgi:hypothetical protein
MRLIRNCKKRGEWGGVGVCGAGYWAGVGAGAALGRVVGV